MILVTGTGRCGTSTVARLLHEQLSVPMGFRFRAPDQDNPWGYYEDLDFKELNERMLAGRVSHCKWIEETKRLIFRRRQQHSGEWGVKDPRTAHFLNEYRLLGQPIIIDCYRDREPAIKSLMRCYFGKNRGNAERVYDLRRELIDAVAKRADKYYKIDFTDTLPDEQVLLRLKGILDEE